MTSTGAGFGCEKGEETRELVVSLRGRIVGVGIVGALLFSLIITGVCLFVHIGQTDAKAGIQETKNRVNQVEVRATAHERDSMEIEKMVHRLDYQQEQLVKHVEERLQKRMDQHDEVFAEFKKAVEKFNAMRPD